MHSTHDIYIFLRVTMFQYSILGGGSVSLNRTLADWCIFTCRKFPAMFIALYNTDPLSDSFIHDVISSKYRCSVQILLPLDVIGAFFCEMANFIRHNKLSMHVIRTCWQIQVINIYRVFCNSRLKASLISIHVTGNFLWCRQHVD